MTTPHHFYTNQIDLFTKDLQKLKTKLNISSAVRLTVFLAAALGIYLSLGNGKLIITIVIIGIAAFLILVTRHSKLQYEKSLVQALIASNELELKVLDRDFYDLPDGMEHHNPEHVYSQDIDMFGRGSFYQYLNRTALQSGSKKLVEELLSNKIDCIENKQEAISELANLAQWRQRFAAIATLVKTEVSTKSVIGWLDNYETFTPKFIKIFARIFSLISLIVLSAYFFGVIAGWWVFLIFGIGLLITGRFVKKINQLSTHTSKIQTTFTQYSKLLSQIENKEFKSLLLSKKRNQIITDTTASSSILYKFSKKLDALDQRNNIIIGFLANGFFLRDLAIVSDIEQWILSNKASIPNWFQVIDFYDAYNTLGNYTFNHPNHIFPKITPSGNTMVATAVAHPLLSPEVAVRNDVTIDHDQFFIITGANMAGKSTFLRTIALQIVMSNVGLPVSAKEVSYTPIKLITSMRTTDSLTDDESYFFSELKRLKFIVDQIKTDRYFIILDEILKGTNSTDKAVGSRKFINKLVASGATGIIATHDLSLCEAANDLSQVQNYYFDAQIIDDELYFDYTFKKGICQNMNASFLLKKMEIVE
ncbi:MutS-related protein [Dokdonia sp. Hel_I_53]|uniref:MutS-related protein n=1 Tax=Dokdonia sp. Hel_I_53 TaxID=1566287 RepID=UPI00119C51B6|nr:DNA mismatch repair protein MutS [Dokdonia sp. Hel_I_53]TVZ52410.1 MutS-like protein [Dokdonia sp. Hel_I_53]